MFSPAEDLLITAGGVKYGTILADPPWQFQNRTGKVAPEHKRLNRYGTMTLEEICELPVQEISADRSHLYLWVPNALLPDGLKVMESWGFRYISNIVWEKVRKDGDPPAGFQHLYALAPDCFAMRSRALGASALSYTNPFGS